MVCAERPFNFGRSAMGYTSRTDAFLFVAYTHTKRIHGGTNRSDVRLPFST